MTRECPADAAGLHQPVQASEVSEVLALPCPFSFCLWIAPAFVSLRFRNTLPQLFVQSAKKKESVVHNDELSDDETYEKVCTLMLMARRHARK